MPKDPNKPDIVELESRILYSANPFFLWNGLDVAPEPTGLWDCPPSMNQDFWDTHILAFAEVAKDAPDLQQLADAIRIARGLNAQNKPDNDDSNAIAVDPSDSDPSDSDVNDISDNGSIEYRMEERFDRIERLMAGLADPENSRVVLHGTDGTAALGNRWLLYGYNPTSRTEQAAVGLHVLGMRLDPDGSVQMYGCGVSPDAPSDALLHAIASSVAHHSADSEFAAPDDPSPTLEGSHSADPQWSAWSLESHLNEIDSLNAWHLQVHTHMNGLLAHYNCQPQSESDTQFALIAISTWDLPEASPSQSDSDPSAIDSGVLLLNAPTGLNVSIAVQPNGQPNGRSVVHMFWTGLPTARIDAENASEIDAGRNVPSPLGPCENTPYERVSPEKHAILAAKGCMLGLMWIERPTQLTDESAGYHFIVNDGLANLSPESPSIFELRVDPRVEQLSSTVPAPQKPTQDNPTFAEQLPFTEVPEHSELTDSAPPAHTEIAFVQAGLFGSDALIADLQANALATGRDLVIIVLNGTENGFDQINSVLSQYNDLDAIHIVSHGSDGMIQLGGSWLTAGNILQHMAELQSWGMALTDRGDILIYGCDVAAGPEGQAFIDTVARLTNADVAASTDKTGDLSRGGNWSFEYVAGGRGIGFQPVSGIGRLEAYPTIETLNAFSLHLQESYGGLLAIFTVTNTNDSGAGSLRQAIINANASIGADTILFDLPTDETVVYLESALPFVSEVLDVQFTGTTNLLIVGNTLASESVFQFLQATGGNQVIGIDFALLTVGLSGLGLEESVLGPNEVIVSSVQTISTNDETSTTATPSGILNVLSFSIMPSDQSYDPAESIITATSQTLATEPGLTAQVIATGTHSE